MLVVVPVGASVAFAVDGVTDGAVGMATVALFGTGATTCWPEVSGVVVGCGVGVAAFLAAVSDVPFEGTHLQRYSPSPVAVHLQSRFVGNCA